jgi:predicted metalloprotease
MKLTKLRRRRGGVIDRRGQGFGGSPTGFGMPVGGGMIGGGAIGLILLVVVLLQFCGQQGGGSAIPGLPDLGGVQRAPSEEAGPAPGDDMGAFVDAVVDDIQVTWDQDIFRPAGRTYRDTAVVLFTQRTSSGCGPASAATGPFYCPADGRVYLDLGFFQELSDRFGAPGDFAAAYVIAHEIGHHVQSLLGIEERVRRESAQDPREANELSVRLELQADCFAGVWASSAYARGALEPGDVQEGLDAAAAVGDDRIQESTRGRVDPESFTHGTSEQRTTWFRHGFDSGSPNDCDTFSADL